jgi:hypothetical protein
MTDSTIARVDAAIAHLKAYSSPTLGRTLAQLTAGRVFNDHGGKNQPRPDALFPRVHVREMNGQTDVSITGRWNFDLELMCHHRDRTKGADLEAIADVAGQALIGWRESSAAAGITVGRDVQRNRLDAATGEGVLAGVDTIRLVVSCWSFPRTLTAALAAS